MTSGTHAAAFVDAIRGHARLMRLLERLRDADLPQGCLAGGCLFQTVWNGLHGLPPEHGIEDYDVFWFDDADLGAEAEAARATALRERCADLGLRLDGRNQARVHLWYEREFGAPSPAFRSARDGIDHFLGVCCSYGVHLDDRGEPQVYAPWGYDDLFALVVRPNPRRAGQGGRLPEAWARKTARWRARWPRLTVSPWPMTDG